MLIDKLIRILELPGIVVHELGHLLFCLILGVKIHKVRLFTFGDPAGYVEHDSAEGFLEAFLISTGPFILGSVLGFYLFRSSLESNLVVLFIYLGLVVSKNSFPSTGDAKALFEQTNWMLKKNPLILIAYPIILVVWIFSQMQKIHLNISYAIILLILAVI